MHWFSLPPGMRFSPSGADWFWPPPCHDPYPLFFSPWHRFPSSGLGDTLLSNPTLLADSFPIFMLLNFSVTSVPATFFSCESACVSLRSLPPSRDHFIPFFLVWRRPGRQGHRVFFPQPIFPLRPPSQFFLIVPICFSTSLRPPPPPFPLFFRFRSPFFLRFLTFRTCDFFFPCLSVPPITLDRPPTSTACLRVF